MAAKLEIEEAKTRINRNMAISRYLGVGNSGSLTVIREAHTKLVASVGPQPP